MTLRKIAGCFQQYKFNADKFIGDEKIWIGNFRSSSSSSSHPDVPAS